MRIDKFLGNMGIGTRSEVKQFIKKGLVKLNGDKVKTPKTQVRPEQDDIRVNDERVLYEPFVYIMLHKPKGYVSATEDDVHPTVIDLIPEYQHLDIFPVGRLDKDTTGLLFITNDGKFNHHLMNPKQHVEKVYKVEAAQPVRDQDVEAFKAGITLKEDKLKPAKLTIGDDSNLAYVTLTEGKYHQVKRMFHAIDNEVEALHRERIGELELDASLEEGAYRKLTDKEMNLLNYKI